MLKDDGSQLCGQLSLPPTPWSETSEYVVYDDLQLADPQTVQQLVAAVHSHHADAAGGNKFLYVYVGKRSLVEKAADATFCLLQRDVAAGNHGCRKVQLLIRGVHIKKWLCYADRDALYLTAPPHIDFLMKALHTELHTQNTCGSDEVKVRATYDNRGFLNWVPERLLPCTTDGPPVIYGGIPRQNHDGRCELHQKVSPRKTLEETRISGKIISPPASGKEILQHDSVNDSNKPPFLGSKESSDIPSGIAVASDIGAPIAEAVRAPQVMYAASSAVNGARDEVKPNFDFSSAIKKKGGNGKISKNKAHAIQAKGSDVFLKSAIQNSQPKEAIGTSCHGPERFSTAATIKEEINTAAKTLVTNLRHVHPDVFSDPGLGNLLAGTYQVEHINILSSNHATFTTAERKEYAFTVLQDYYLRNQTFVDARILLERICPFGRNNYLILLLQNLTFYPKSLTLYRPSRIPYFSLFNVPYAPRNEDTAVPPNGGARHSVLPHNQRISECTVTYQHKNSSIPYESKRSVLHPDAQRRSSLETSDQSAHCAQSAEQDEALWRSIPQYSGGACAQNQLSPSYCLRRTESMTAEENGNSALHSRSKTERWNNIRDHRPTRTTSLDETAASKLNREDILAVNRANAIQLPFMHPRNVKLRMKWEASNAEPQNAKNSFVSNSSASYSSSKQTLHSAIQISAPPLHDIPDLPSYPQVDVQYPQNSSALRKASIQAIKGKSIPKAVSPKQAAKAYKQKRSAAASAKLKVVSASFTLAPPKSRLGTLCFFWDLEATGLNVTVEDITQIACICRRFYFPEKAALSVPGDNNISPSNDRTDGCESCRNEICGGKSSGSGTTEENALLEAEIAGTTARKSEEKNEQVDAGNRVTYSDYGVWEVVKAKNSTEEFNCYISTKRKIPGAVVNLTGITNQYLNENGVSFEKALNAWRDWVLSCCENFPGAPIWFVAHNGNCYDLPLLFNQEKTRLHQPAGSFLRSVGATGIIDSVILSRRLQWGGGPRRSHKLQTLFFDIFNKTLENEHDALGDVTGLAALMEEEPFYSAWCFEQVGWSLHEYLERACSDNNVDNEHVDEGTAGASLSFSCNKCKTFCATAACDASSATDSDVPDDYL